MAQSLGDRSFDKSGVSRLLIRSCSRRKSLLRKSLVQFQHLATARFFFFLPAYLRSAYALLLCRTYIHQYLPIYMVFTVATRSYKLESTA